MQKNICVAHKNEEQITEGIRIGRNYLLETASLSTEIQHSHLSLKIVTNECIFGAVKRVTQSRRL